MSGSSLPRPILVVDDDAKIVRLVRTYLERDGHRVVEARDGRAALAAIALEEPALVVLDVMLPEVDGLAVLRAVRRGGATTPVLILSARGTVGDRIAGLAAGADDYLPKPFSPSELVLRVERILERAAAPAGPGPEGGSRQRPAREPLSHGDLRVDRDRHEASIEGRPLNLTSVEFRLLVAILEADGRVLSRDQLLDAVHGEDAVEILDRTIDVHIRRLRDKLQDDPVEPRYIATVRGAGYRAAPLPAPAPGPKPSRSASPSTSPSTSRSASRATEARS
ncbi:MAG: response regulator transcription factor [Chloroflexi bacterium]|nr:response regulator transcription factor [Chloroflexota bacterium]